MRSIIRLQIPPWTSTPRERGVTSKSKISEVSPASTAPWIAAPAATHSIGSTPRSNPLPTIFLTNSWTEGIRVGPPTRITLSILETESFESSIARLIGSSHLLRTTEIRSSSLARVNEVSKWIGFFSESWAINGRLISVVKTVDNSIFAFSAPSLSLCIALESLRKSIDVLWTNVSTR